MTIQTTFVSLQSYGVSNAENIISGSSHRSTQHQRINGPQIFSVARTVKEQQSIPVIWKANVYCPGLTERRRGTVTVFEPPTLLLPDRPYEEIIR